MAGLCGPLSTLRRGPRGHLRMTRGRCGSLLLHRDGLPPSTPCRSPGALRSPPVNGHHPMARLVRLVPPDLRDVRLVQSIEHNAQTPWLAPNNVAVLAEMTISHQQRNLVGD